MRIKEITPMAVKDRLIKTVRRFPLTIVFTALFAVFAMTMVWHPRLLPGAAKTDILFYLAEGVLLSMAMRFWDERSGNRHQWQQITAHVLLLGMAVMWLFLGFLGQGLVMAHLSVVVSLLMACVFLPFGDEHDDIAACNFGAHLVKSGIVAPLAGFVPTIALSLLVLVSFPVFFQIDATYKDYWSIVIFFQIVFPMLLFLSKIVEGERMTNRHIKVSSGVAGIAKIVLIPATVIYMAILYCYACHIALAWELPNGGVSYMVAVMMGMFFMVEAYLYFTNHSGGKETAGWFLRWLPLFIIPLLVLMTVGICRRINDYGLTAARLYLATLNVWFYIVCFVMLRTKVKRIHWIPISFCILFVLTSVLPVNFHSIARDYIINDLNEKAEKGNMSDADWKNRVDYLRDYYQIDYSHPNR